METPNDEPAPPRRSGRRAILLWIGIPIAVLLLIPLAVEGWRQNEHRAARAELKAELLAFDARFAGQDIDAWYRARVPANDGSAALRAVAAAWSSKHGAEGLVWTSVLLDGIEHDLLEPGPDTEKRAKAILEFTQPAHDGLLGLTRFESLWCLPDVHDEVYVATIMLPAVPRQRAAALMALGRHDEARESLVFALEIASRLRYPANFEHANVALNAASNACSTLREQVETMRFSAPQAQRLLDATRPWPDLRQWVAEGEAAHFARLWRGVSDRDDWHALFVPDDSSGFFGWIDPERSWSTMSRQFLFAAQHTRDLADYMRTRRAAIERNGAPSPDGDDPLGEVEWGVQSLNADLLVIRAVATLRLAQANGTPWEQLALDPAQFAGLVLARDGEAILIRTPGDPDMDYDEDDLGDWEVRLLP